MKHPIRKMTINLPERINLCGDLLPLWLKAIEEEKKFKESMGDLPPMTWKDYVFILLVGLSPLYITIIYHLLFGG